MTSKKPFFYASLLFLSGAVFGAICLHVVFRYHIMRGFEHRHGDMVPVVMKRLDHELDLNEEQQERIRPIVEDMQNRLRELKRETKPRIEGILDDAVSKAEPALNDEQKGKLRELEGRVKAHFERRERDRQPPD